MEEAKRRQEPQAVLRCSHNQLHSQAPVHTSGRRRQVIVSKIFVIVNVTTLIINLKRLEPLPVEASSVRAPARGAAEAQQSPTDGGDQFSPGSVMMANLQVSTEGSGGPGAQSRPRQQSSNGQNSTDLKQLANNEETNALIYLQKYGYMSAHSNSEANNLISEDSFSQAVASFQRFAGIMETGVVDNQTLRYMQLPRCGNLDKASNGELPSVKVMGKLRNSPLAAASIRRRRKRYALQGSKWRRQELTYRISQYPTRFTGKRHEVDAQIEKAFGIWSQVAPIDFVVKKDGRVHIDIRFASGDHGDGDAFDGPGNTLAHAYFPQYGGDAHFDDQEYWTIDSYAGTNIFQVAAHELGHSLGLGHSNVREALMAPFYQKYKPNFRLHIDDVLAIQALYGEKSFLGDVPQAVSAANGGSQQSVTSTSTTSTTPSTTTTTTSTPASTTTTQSSKDQPAITTRHSGGGRAKPGIYYAGARPWKPGGGGGQGGPDVREMNDDENGIPDLSAGSGGDDSPGRPGLLPFAPRPGGAQAPPIGASGGSSAAGYPADLCSDSVIDAITRTEDGNSYVFKGDFYWLLTSDGLAKGYPRRIQADWDGLPGSLDAALTWADGKTFFFKGNKYWRYRNKRREVGYPKLISAGFAGIPDDIDAAFVWSGNGRTYIFKGTEYWRFDSKTDPPVSSEYPRSIKVWQGVPSYVNAAFKWENNVTYFFKGNQYYRFNDKDFKVESKGRPPFPRLSAEWWFGCVSSNLAQRALPSNLRDGADFSAGYAATDNQDGDWSFFGGLEEGTRILGTHINDHKPPASPTRFTGSPEGSSSMTIATNSGHHHHHATTRIGLHDKQQQPTRVSSSAITNTKAPFNSMIALSLATTLCVIITNGMMNSLLSMRRCHYF